MYNVSSNSTILEWYKNGVYNPNRRLKFELYINDNLIDNAYVLDRVEIEYDTMQDGFSVGNIVYSKLSFSLYSSVIIFEMANISIFISVEIFNTSTNKYEYIRVPFGQYKVTDIESTKLQHKITAYDKYYNQLQMPFVKTKNQYTSGEIINQISSETGIEFENFPTDVVLANEDIVTKTEQDGVEVEEHKDGTNFDNQTYASILSQVAGVCGGNIIFSREGKCKLVVGLPQSDVAVLPQDFTEPTIKPFTYDKKRLEITKREDLQPIKVGEEVVTSNQTLAIANPLFTTDSANRVLDIVNDISYQPISTKIMIMPLHLEPLDVISILYEDSTLKIPLMKYKLTFAGGLSGEMESFVSNQTQSGYQGSLTTQVSNLSSQVANLTSLTVGSLVVGDLQAIQIKVDELVANVAKINTLVAGNLTAENFQSMNITSDKFTMSDGFIKDAHIMNVNASKINAGQINTSNVSIGSRNDDGEMLISDNTIQINDKNGTRIQIGKDAQGQYNLYVWDKNGALMWSANGLTQDGIQDAIIRDDMVSDDANINAKKLDIESLFTQMNADGSNTLYASKILLDTQNQTLNIGFNEMTTKQELLTEITDTHTTQLNTQQGQIDTLIKNTTITDDGQTTTLKDAYSQFVQTQNGFNLKVEEHESKFNNLKIGTRNYLANTGTPFTMTGDNTTNQTSTMYHFVNKDNSPIIGGEATFAFKYKIEEGATGSIRIQTNGQKTGDATEGKWFSLYRNDNITTMENEGQIVYTRTYNESELHTFNGIALRLDNFVGSITIYECSMVVGNEFGGWQPAPEDTGEALSSLEVRVSSAEQQVTKDAIISKVSSTFVKQTDFNNLTIGGENLIINSNFNFGFENWKGSTTQYYITEDNMLGYNKTDLTEAKNYQVYTYPIDVSNLVGKEVTVSFDYKIIDKTQQSTITLGYIRFFDADHEDSNAQADSIAYKNLNISNNYVNETIERAMATVTVPTGAKYARVGAYQSRNGNMYWSNFQLEVGNKATSWKPSSSDITLYADNSNDMLQNELNDLKNIADLSNNADVISPDMKTKLISEGEDAESVYNKLVYMYQDVMSSPVEYKSLFTNMKNSYSTLSSEVAYLKSSQNEISDSGLGDILQCFNNFYANAEELNEEILNSLKGITDSLSTEIEQLAESVTIKVNQFSSELDSISTHFIFDTNGLTIKSTANASKYIKLDNDSLDFIDNGQKVAEITDQQLNISKAQITSDMKIGNMKIKPSGTSKNGVIFVFE